MLVVHTVSYIPPFAHCQLFSFWQRHELMINKYFDSFTFSFFHYQPIGMCYLVMLWIASSKILEFPSVYGHKCWSVPTECSPLSLQAGMRRQDWASMRWYMSFQCLPVIVGDFCDRQQHVGRCSGSEQSLDTWTVPSPRCCAIFSHYHCSPRCHMLSSASWCNMAPSFHEY